MVVNNKLILLNVFIIGVDQVHYNLMNLLEV
jgi:hypothetical protein